MTQQLPPSASPEQPAAGYAPAPAPARTNTMAILAIVFAFVFSPLGIVFGVVGRKQSVERHENGRGLATAGMWLSIAFTVIGLATAVLVGVLAASVATQVPQLPDTTQQPGTSQGPGTAQGPSVAPDALATEVAAQYSAEDVSCPEPLPAQVGASTVCTGTVAGGPARLGVTVTTVEGTQVGFRITPVG